MNQGHTMRGNAVKTKVFDPADGFAPLLDLAEISDATLARRGDRWWLFLAGQRTTSQEITLFSASLAEGAPLSAKGWMIAAQANDPTRVAPLEGSGSTPWERSGGRHCPAFVKGIDPATGKSVERVYYARDGGQPWGPYSLGCLEWDGSHWNDKGHAVFAATQEWEHGSVYEPNLIYADGKWRMWYVAGSNGDDYLIQAYVESADGLTNWSTPKVFGENGRRLFDFNVFEGKQGYEALFSRVWVGKGPPPPETGLWWCQSRELSSSLADWGTPVQVLTAADCGWHSGPWRPAARYGSPDSGRITAFFDGIYKIPVAGPFPFSFTVGCLEFDRPAVS